MFYIPIKIVFPKKEYFLNDRLIETNSLADDYNEII